MVYWLRRAVNNDVGERAGPADIDEALAGSDLERLTSTDRGSHGTLVADADRHSGQL